MAHIETRNLVKRFGGEQILKSIDLEVEKGEIFGLIGPSGSGKSTLMRLLTGYLEPSEGEVRVFGEPPANFGPEYRRKIGFMPQGFVLYGQLSVYQNLNFVAGLYELGSKERRHRVRQALEFVELWPHRRKPASSISGGMQRRLQLAGAIVHEPEVLFFDEPTASLDPVLRRKFWDEFEQLRESGTTIFVTTQYVGEAEHCDRVGLLEEGRLVAVGSPQELRRKAFGGDLIEVVLGENLETPTRPLEVLEEFDQLVELHRDQDANGPTIRARLQVQDADVELPRTMKALENADLRSAQVLYPSFDEVFFSLIQGEGRAQGDRGTKT